MSSAFTIGEIGAAVGIGSSVVGLFGDAGGGGSTGNVAGGAYYDPYASYRGKAATTLDSLIYGGSGTPPVGQGGNSPTDIVKGLPGYQFGMNAGADTLNRTMAKTGQTQSGGQQIALSEFGQQYAGSYYDKMVNNLMGMSGATQSPMNTVGQNDLNAKQTQGNWQGLSQGIGSFAGMFPGSSGNNSPANFGPSGYTNGDNSYYTPTNTNVGMGGYSGDANMGGGTLGPSW